MGGTNTDAVAMDGREVLAAVKTPTTQDIGSGVSSAITELLTKGGIEVEAIDAVMIGTTHFINAFVERKELAQIGILRIALPACTSIPPMSDWPADLRSKLGNHIYQIAGGRNFDGRPISALDETQIKTVARKIRKAGIKSIAITSVFSPASPDMEARAAEIIEREIDDAHVTLSHQVGALGLLERENAAIINATLRSLSNHVITGLEGALDQLGINAPLFLSQNDGTLMNPTLAKQYPIRTFASGATNSMRGAYFLSGEANAIVADIGGTTTDVGALVNGYPRETAAVVNIGGVRTNFRMPDAISIGLGGGSKVSVKESESGDTEVTIGPESVGYLLTKKAIVFGGDTLTATDIAVAAGSVQIGAVEKVAHLDSCVLNSAADQIHQMLSKTVDQMKVGIGAVPLVLVGGGSILVKDAVEGTSNTVTPKYANVANAVGAAIAQVGVHVERLVSYEVNNRDDELNSAKEEVHRLAVDAGGDRSTVSIVDVEEVQLAYMPGNCVRLRVRGVADLRTDGIASLRAAGVA